jgi:hypothetical protein
MEFIMIVYTVIRHIGNKNIPLRNFESSKDAEEWAELQMKFLDKDYLYSIALWDLKHAQIVPCKDKRLRLVK